MIEIFHSLIPRADLENYRIMRSLPTAAYRLGLHGSDELNGLALTKLFQSVLEVIITYTKLHECIITMLFIYI
jgi:hypothetical protein